MKIFISIVSYRDPLLEYTVTEAYNNAKHKENLVFGIVEQSYANEALRVKLLPFYDQIRYIRVEPEQSRGCCWARNIAHSMWDGEEYYFQIDSHIGFDQDWDQYFLDNITELAQWHEKPVITAYPDAMEAENDDISNPIVKQPYRNKGTITSIVTSPDGGFGGPNGFFLGQHGHNHETENHQTHGFLLAAGALFTYGKVCAEVPYDPKLFFAGEEQLYALRLWTHGYSLFHCKDMPLYHYYGNEYRITIWDKRSDKLRGSTTEKLQVQSIRRQNEVFSGKDYGPYGLGIKRTIYDYAEWTGIDYGNLVCEPQAYTGEKVFNHPIQDPPPCSKVQHPKQQTKTSMILSGQGPGLILSGGE